MTRSPKIAPQADRRQALEALASPKGDSRAGLPDETPTALEWQALSLVAKKAGPFRDALEPGNGQAVDFVAHVKGSIDVGADQTATITKKPELARMLAIALSMCPKRLRGEVVEELVARAGYPEIVVPQEWVELVESVIGQCSREQPQERRGNVTGSLATEITRRGR